MAALTVGTQAPEFELRAMDGKRFVLRDELARGHVVLAFLKVSCPVCQYAVPFLQRLRQLHGDQHVTLIGISQDAAKPTALFMKEFGATFPVLLDEPDRYPVSNAYGLTNVPTVFWINQSFEIEISSVSWSKAEMEAIHRKMGETDGAMVPALFRADEEIRDYRPG